MTYASLPIHKKINCKGNCLILYRNNGRPLIKRVKDRDTDCYTPVRLLNERYK